MHQQLEHVAPAHTATNYAIARRRRAAAQLAWLQRSRQPAYAWASKAGALQLMLPRRAAAQLVAPGRLKPEGAVAPQQPGQGALRVP